MWRIGILLLVLSAFVRTGLLAAGENEIVFLFVTEGFDIPEAGRRVVREYAHGLVDNDPLVLYRSRIVLYHLDSTQPCFSIVGDGLVRFKVKDIYALVDLVGSESDCTVIIKNRPGVKSLGGTVGKRRLPVVMVGTGISSPELYHEVCHALFQLGDEYGGRYSLPAAAYESARWKNLTAEVPDGDWEQIRRDHNLAMFEYHEGGGGHDTGVYHAYRFCLMGDLAHGLCGLCRFYAIDTCNNLSGLSIPVTPDEGGNSGSVGEYPEIKSISVAQQPYSM
jgi:hypothetical protein